MTGAGAIGRARRLALAAAAALVLAWHAAPPLRAGAAWSTSAAVLPVRYAIAAELGTVGGDEVHRLLKGRETIAWTNTAAEPADSLYFHLYANAFRNSRSTFVRELLRDGGKLPDEMTWGGVEITQMTLLGRPLAWEFVQPDDGNPDDRTVVRARLEEPVEPGAEIVLGIEFTTELPSVFRRMGASRDYVFAAQWYPKLGRFLGKGSGHPNLRDGWYCHQYHAAAEFCADFADYTVTLKVPAAWKTGATGALDPKSVSTNDATRVRTETWEARSVVDFAWTASPRFVVEERTVSFDGPPRAGDPVADELHSVRLLLDLPQDEVALPPVLVRVLLQPEHQDQMDRHVEAARKALGLYGAWFGPYPYAQLTVVDPAFGGESSGGMEYPQLVTAGTTVGARRDSLNPEFVIVHEVGHQWFMNLFASNEAEEAPLDEGLNSWATARALHAGYAKGGEPPVLVTTILGRHWPTELPYTFPGLHLGWPETLRLPKWAHPPDLEAFRLWRDAPLLAATEARRYLDDPYLPARRSYLRDAGWDEMVRPGWEYVHRGSYRANSYPRPILLVETLARTLVAQHGAEEGERRLLRAFRGYAREQRFRHPRTEDLLRAFREHSGLDPAPLWNALARTSERFDVAIEEVKDAADPPLEGVTDADGTRKVVPRGEDGAPKKERTAVLVRRRGEVVLPVTVRAIVRAGARDVLDVRTWDGAERWKRFVYEGRVKEVSLDPDRIYLQDARLTDNVWSERENPQPSVKWGVQTLLWLENALTSWGRFF